MDAIDNKPTDKHEDVAGARNHVLAALGELRAVSRSGADPKLWVLGQVRGVDRKLAIAAGKSTTLATTLLPYSGKQLFKR